MGDHANYYRDALRYLGCLDVAEIPGMGLFGISVRVGVSVIYTVIITSWYQAIYRDLLRYLGCLHGHKSQIGHINMGES